MRTATQTSILVVDDDAHFGETLSDALSLKDIAVETATTGAEALDQVVACDPSLIILDVQLPDMHGFDLCRRLKRDPRTKNKPIVFLSAKFTEPADRAEGLLSGADAYLSKPIGLDTLWDEVSYLLDNGD